MGDNNPSIYRIDDFYIESILNTTSSLLSQINLNKYIRKPKHYDCNQTLLCCVIMNEFQYEHKYLQSIKYLEESYKGEYNCADILYFLHKNGICHTKYLRYDKNKNYTPSCIFNAERYKVKGFCKILTLNGLKKTLNVYGPATILLPIYNKTTMPWRQQFKCQTIVDMMPFIVYGYEKDYFLLYNYHKDFINKYIFKFNDFGIQLDLWAIMNDYNDDTFIKTKNKKKKFFL